MKVLVLAKLDDHDRIVQDFSKNFLQDDTEIHLLNAVLIPSEIPLKMNGEVIDVCTEYNLQKYYDLRDTHQATMEKYLEGMNVKIRKAFIGNPLQIVKWYVKENNIDLVVSGGHLTTQREDVFSSSFANHLLQTLSVPYLSVKAESDISLEMNTIAIVREFVDPAARNLELIKKLQEKFNSKIVFVKINTPNNHMNEIELKQKMQLFADLNELKDVEFVTINASEKENAIKDLIVNYKIDLLTLGHIHRNGISSFLRGDLRADVLNHVNIPIYMY